MSTEERWDLIEEYFLGNDDYVAARLGLEPTTGGLPDDEVTTEVRFRGKRSFLLASTQR
ncbi:hypothetical protein ACULPM_03730 [Thermophilibacter sp. ZX-H3]